MRSIGCANGTHGTGRVAAKAQDEAGHGDSVNGRMTARGKSRAASAGRSKAGAASDVETQATSTGRATFTLSRSFIFEAAHSLDRRDMVSSVRDASRRIHGHSYRATVQVTGAPDAATGMLLDLGHLERELACVRERLDHRLLDDVAGLGPATLENLCLYLWRALSPRLPTLARVSVGRDLTGDACSLAYD